MRKAVVIVAMLCQAASVNKSSSFLEKKELKLAKFMTLFSLPTQRVFYLFVFTYKH